ncbi:hypothetical protein B0H13DRAFT_2657917 [Mycena leptocephala]|nr:hypothetical protein B0H13DRAFT_2657917 [Mycena leptocephala]
MSALPPARSPSLEENAAKPQLAEGTSDPAEFLGLPASESMTSTGSQYHSALNSPISCETLDPPTVEEQLQGRDLISFSSGNLSGLPRILIKSLQVSVPCKPQLDADVKESGKTPNVYINGLPPNFREDQLRAIAAPFGEVLSVRCFTRQTLKSPSGYGFVLFKTLAAAEKCILTLRRSDLHPSFSKVNKPLRVVHSPNSPILELPAPSSLSSLGSSDSESALPGSPELDFKAKMAQLEDKNSPNVYIEGLPMSADKNTLMELVYPYAIQSTRFLRSKLPQSQTMIAFMSGRECILRLNGKNVRGWDGTESRVYLRIADTLDQRELRRSEASNREDDPGRLTSHRRRCSIIVQRISNPPVCLQSTRQSRTNAPSHPSRSHGCDGPRSADGESGGGPAPSSPANQFIPDTLRTPWRRISTTSLRPTRPRISARPHSRKTRCTRRTRARYPRPASEYAPQPRGAIRVPCGDAAARSAAAGVSSPVMAMFPNHFNTNVNVKLPVPSVQNHNPNIMQAAFHQSTPAENFVMQARAEMEMQTRAKLQSLGINPMPNVRPAAAPGLAVPPQFFSPAVTAAPSCRRVLYPLLAPISLKPFPIVHAFYAASTIQPASQTCATTHAFCAPSPSNPPPPRPAQPHTALLHALRTTLSYARIYDPHASAPNEILKPMNGSGLARQPSFTSTHARASTAPVAPRQHSNVPQ